MIKQALAAGAAAFFTIASAHAGMPLNQWLGGWDKNAGELEFISVSNSSGALTVSVKGQCSPNPCDWGSAPATAYSNSAATEPASSTEAIIAVFNQGFATKTVVLDGRAGDMLRAHVYTHFVDGSGRKDYLMHSSMKKAALVLTPLPGGPLIATPVKPFSEDCISFDPDAVSVEQNNGRWKLVQGSMWMLDAGPNKSEMDRAKTIVQHYGFNKQCYVGRPDASLEYWLVGAAAPSGALAGEDCTNINPNGLSVRNAGGGRFTILSNGSHAAFSAPSAAEAQKVIDVIEFYGFTRSCFVGRPGPSMRYLRK